MLTWIIRVLLFFTVASYPAERLGVVTVGPLILSVAKGLTAVLLGFAWIHWMAFGRSETARRDTKLLWILALTGSIGISALYSYMQGMDTTILVLRVVSYLSVIVMYAMLVQLAPTRRDLDVALGGWIAGCALIAVTANVLPSEGSVWGPQRLGGVGAGENENAGNMLFALAASYALFATTRSNFKRLVLVVAATLHGLGFLLAASRSALLGAAGMTGRWIMQSLRARDARGLFILLGLAVAGIIFVPEAYIERITSTRVLDERTRGADVRSRLEREGLAVVAFVTHPVVGVGTGRFPFWAADDGILSKDVHNAILKAAAEQGIVGLVPYLAILTLTWTQLTRATRTARRYAGDPEMKALGMRAAMIQTGYIGLFTVSLFQPGTYFKGMWMIFAVATVVSGLVRQRAAELGVDQPYPGPPVAHPEALHA